MAYNDLHTSFITLKNYLTILQSGKTTFWAADLGLSGGAINALANYRFIAETGVTKEAFIEINPWSTEKLYKKVTVKEWRVRNLDEWTATRLIEDINALADLVNGYNALV